MTKEVTVAGVGVFNFPDDATEDQMRDQIQRTIATGEGIPGGQITPEQRQGRIAALEAEQAGLEGPSVLSAIGGAVSDIRGLPEAALELATGGIATAAGGVAAIPATAFAAATGAEDPAGAGRAVIERFQELGTFQPRTEVGQRASAAIAAPLESFEQLADRIGEESGESGSVLDATIVKTIILAAPILFGLRRGGVRTRPAQKPTPRQEVARISAEEGYVTPPSVRGEAGVRGTVEGVGGKIKTAQLAVEKNQPVTNNLAARAVGLPEGTPLSVDILKGVRAEAGQAFEAIRDAGQIVTDTTFRKELSAATAKFRSAARDFPELAKTEVLDLVDSLRVDAFDAASGVDAMSLLRNRADVAFRGGDAALGRSYRAASDALEAVIERHLARGGDVALLENFKTARQQIAQTYSVEEALRAGAQVSGDVNAANLASQLKKGKPLTGDLLTIAEFANTFPTVSKLFTAAPQRFSPLDLFVGSASVGASGTAAAFGAGPAALIPLAATVARPLLRRSALRGVSEPAGATTRATPGAVLGGVISAGVQQ